MKGRGHRAPDRAGGDRAREYLAAVLPLDPCDDAAAIVAHRAAFLGRPHEESAADADERERVRARLKALRQDFWSLDPEACAARIDGIAARSFPDLARQADRLRAVVNARRELARAEESTRVDPGFLAHLAAASIAPPPAAAQLWLAAVETLRVPAGDGSRPLAPLRLARKTVRELARRFPAVYALERPWLREVAAMQGKPRSSGASNAWIWLGLLVAMAGVVHGILGGGAP